MYSFDFFSSPPEFSIFHNKINKTRFGGTLFLLYLILMSFISFIYIIDFLLKEVYEIECYNIFVFKEVNPNNKELNKIPMPVVNFTIITTFFQLSEDWKIFEERIFLRINSNEKIKPNSHIPLDHSNNSLFIFDFYNINISDNNNISLIYKCKEVNCLDLSTFYPGGVAIQTNDFGIDNYAEYPFKIGEKKYIRSILFLNKNYSMIQTLTWESIVYEEKKGITKLLDEILNKENKFIYGYIKEHNEYDNKFQYNEDKNEIVFATIQNNLNSHYIDYKRTKKNFLDVLAKIGALFSTFNFIVSTFFKFYKKNFDNYKIVEKIMRSKYIKMDKNFNFKKANIEFNNNIFQIDKETNIEKNSPLINDNFNENKGINETGSDIEDEKKEDEDKVPKRYLPKLSFFDYFYNNVYCKCCKKVKRQEIIDTCNEMVFKYTSIDKILYHQMRLENLLKDYKWNNPELNTIGKNELITKLQNLAY